MNAGSKLWNSLAVGAAAICMCLLASSVFAQTTGKITGVVTDPSTGEVLPGVNVIIAGTTMGAATDVRGEYFILGVMPGTYSLRATFIGYREMVVEEVRVQGGLTTRIDFELEEGALGLEDEIVVTAQRPVIRPDETASVNYLTVRELAELPVTSAREAMMVQAGVFFDPIPVIGGIGGAGRGEPRFAVRGGEQGQIKWYLNGHRTAALIEGRADQGGSYMNINMHAIQEMQIFTGGYSAEYGEAQSGVVNVVLKDGGPRFSGSFEYLYSPPGQRHFGNYLFDTETQKEFLDHTLEDGTLDPQWWTPYRQSHMYDYRQFADHHGYLSFGGPMFRINDRLATIFVASQLQREAYAVPRPRDYRELEDGLVNIWLPFRQDMHLRFMGLYSHFGHSTLQENGDFTNQSKYYRGWGSLLDNYTYLAAATFMHTLSSRLFYDLRLSWYLFDSKEHPSEFTELGESENPDIWGFQRYNGFPNEPFDAWAPIFDDHRQVGDVSLVGSTSWQANNANFLKTGFELRYNTVREIKANRYPSFSMHPDDWYNRGLHETFHPIQGALYVHNKMEFESMILNLGVRYDYFNPNRDWFTSRDIFNLAVDPDYDADLDPGQTQVDERGRKKYSFDNVLDKPRAPARSYHMISPRFGVSFPISEHSVLHFNYGHFYQMPPLDRMFEFNYFRPAYIVRSAMRERERAEAEGREPNHIPSNDGDPERVVFLTLEPLKPEKTISFEAGIRHHFQDLAVLEVTGFYKDVFDQALAREGLFDRTIYMWDPFRNQIHPNVGFASHYSGDYGDARGFEVRMRTLFSRHMTLDANYSFSKATQGRATPGSIRYDQDGNPTYRWPAEVHRRVPVERQFSRPHILRANLHLRYPEVRQTGVLNTVLRGSSLSVLFRYVSGQAFTYLGPDDPPDTFDNHRYPATRLVDLRAERSFDLFGSHSMTIYTNVLNLLNTRNVRSIGDIFFDAEAVKRYVETGEVSTVDGAGYDISWQTYHRPRQVFLGMRYSW